MSGKCNAVHGAKVVLVLAYWLVKCSVQCSGHYTVLLIVLLNAVAVGFFLALS